MFSKRYKRGCWIYTLVTSVCCFSRSLELLLGLPMQILHFNVGLWSFQRLIPVPCLLYERAILSYLCLFVCEDVIFVSMIVEATKRSNYWIKFNFAHKFSGGKFSVKFGNGQNCLNHIEMAAIWTLKINAS